MSFKRILICIALLSVLLSAHSAPSSVKQLMEKGDSCRTYCQYNKALSYFLQAYDDRSTADNPQRKMQLLERIMRTHYVLRHWKELSEASYQLYHLAKKHDAPAYLSMALFMRGSRYYYVGQKEEGYQTCLNALDMMKNSDYRFRYHELAAYCAILTKMYTKDKCYDDALRMSDDQERYVRMAMKDQTNCKRGLQRVYPIRMALLAELGRFAEADSLYRLFGDGIVTDPICGDALLAYFRLSGKNEESLQFLETAIRNIREDGDTIGRNMLRLLSDQGDIYYRMGQYQQASKSYMSMCRITDSISARSLSNVAAEVDKVIDNEHTMAHHRQMLIVTIAGVVLLLTVVLLLARHSLMERRKNRSMMQMVQQMMHYRNLVIQNGDSVEMGDNGDSTSASEEDERTRFKEVDKRIMKEKLFAQPDFGRDELMRLLGVDKNTVPSIIQRFTGTNVPGYVNNKRMEYAVLLMKQHPEYTLGAISEACGIKSPATFIRNFKAVYGMTPSEFRKQIDESLNAPSILTNDNEK